jgi:LEA14-like dessication related protein
MRMTRFEPFDTRLLIAVIAHNPNSYDVSVDDLEAVLAVNDERLLTGSLTAPVTLKAAADTRVEIEVKTDFVAMATTLQKVTHEGGLRYDFRGSTTVQNQRLPFGRRGEVAARDFLGAPQ